MKLYHYSVDSYNGDKSLKNDFAGHYRFVEPFILALRENISVFIRICKNTDRQRL